MTDEDELSPPPREPSSRDLRRLRVVDGFIDLVLEGEASPTPNDVADRAGVSRATFFRYFSTLDELRGEVAARVRERFPELFVIPAVANGSLDERIERFAGARVQLWETLHPLALLLRGHAARNTDFSDFIDAARRFLAEQARQYFEIDLLPHGPARRDDMVAAIAVMTSVESWQQFRHTYDRSPAQTRRAWQKALAGILTEP